jgi:hypothetical protein
MELIQESNVGSNKAIWFTTRVRLASEIWAAITKPKGCKSHPKRYTQVQGMEASCSIIAYVKVMSLEVFLDAVTLLAVCISSGSLRSCFADDVGTKFGAHKAPRMSTAEKLRPMVDPIAS